MEIRWNLKEDIISSVGMPNIPLGKRRENKNKIITSKLKIDISDD